MPLVIITTIIVLPINNVFSDFRKLDSGYQKYVLIRRAVFVVLNILRSIFLVKVIDKFSSQHLSILKVLESIFMFGYFLIDGKYKDDDKQVNEIVYIPIIAVSFIITICHEHFSSSWLLSARTVRTVKTLMLTCGMYDGSGEFAVRVGIPAKSGVGGGIMGSVENRMGIGTYGPSLDEKGNSIGGKNTLEYLSREMHLHIFDSEIPDLEK